MNGTPQENDEDDPVIMAKDDLKYPLGFITLV